MLVAHSPLPISLVRARPHSIVLRVRSKGQFILWRKGRVRYVLGLRKVLDDHLSSGTRYVYQVRRVHGKGVARLVVTTPIQPHVPGDPIPPAPDLGPLPALGFADTAEEINFPQEYYGDSQLLGTTVVKFYARWSQLQPEEGPIDYSLLGWQELDRVVRESNQHGMRFMLALTAGPPGWARRDYPAATPRMDAWVPFIQALVTRYPTIEMWDLWNEPNCCSVQGRIRTEDLATLVDAAYPIVHQIPNADVIPGSWCPCGSYADGMIGSLRALAKTGARFDSIALHSYAALPTYGVESVSDDSQAFHTGDTGRTFHLLDELWPGRNLRLHINEVGFMSPGGASGDYMDERAQATEGINLLNEYRKWTKTGRLSSVIWFLVRDNWQAKTSLSWTTGVRHQDGMPKDIYYAWRDYIWAYRDGRR